MEKERTQNRQMPRTLDLSTPLFQIVPVMGLGYVLEFFHRVTELLHEGSKFKEKLRMISQTQGNTSKSPIL